MNKKEVIEYLEKNLPDDKDFELSGIDYHALSHDYDDMFIDNIVVNWRRDL